MRSYGWRELGQEVEEKGREKIVDKGYEEEE
jgi:hypothetical protein